VFLKRVNFYTYTLANAIVILGSLLYPSAVRGHIYPSKEAQLQMTQAQSCSKQGKHELAALEYDAALKLDPDCDTLYLLLAGEYEASGEFRKVIATCDRMIGSNPLNPLGFTTRARAYVSLKRYNDAIRDYDKAIELDPRNPKTFFERGNAYTLLHHKHQAWLDYTHTLALPARNAADYCERGFADLELQNHKESIENFNTCVSLQPNVYSGYYGLGLAYGGLKQYQRAIENYNKAISLAPDNAGLYVSRGTTNSALKRYQEALADFDQAITLDSHSFMAHFCRRKLLAELGNPKTSEKSSIPPKQRLPINRRSLTIPPQTEDIVGNYTDDNVVIQAECQLGQKPFPQRHGKSINCDQPIVISVTNKNKALPIESDLSHAYTPICDNQGRYYNGTPPKSIGSETEPEIKSQIGPGETKKYKIRIPEALPADVKFLRLHVWSGEFGNKNSFNIAIYLTGI
jgi:tetratricopeptide (TPR) repeat protein